MGAHFSLNILEGADLCGFADWYKGTVIALMGNEGTPLYDLDLRGPCAFVIGNEGAGISADLAESAKVRARIPTTRPRRERSSSSHGSTSSTLCS